MGQVPMPRGVQSQSHPPDPVQICNSMHPLMIAYMKFPHFKETLKFYAKHGIYLQTKLLYFKQRKFMFSVHLEFGVFAICDIVFDNCNGVFDNWDCVFGSFCIPSEKCTQLPVFYYFSDKYQPNICDKYQQNICGKYQQNICDKYQQKIVTNIRCDDCNPPR